MINDKISLLIADDDHDTCEVLKTFFEMQPNVEICGIAHNGVQALTLIRQRKPDVVLLDVVMPEKDGICVLEDLQTNPPDKRPLIVITSASGQEIVMRKAVSLGADFFIMKPYSLEVLLSRVRMVAGLDFDDNASKAAKSVESVVAKAVLMLGFPTQLLGYQYANKALGILITNKKPCAIIKSVYGSIALEYGTTGECVERAIRQALKQAFANKTDLMCEIIKYGNLTDEKCPSNGRFLTLAAAYIKLEGEF